MLTSLWGLEVPAVPGTYPLSKDHNQIECSDDWDPTYAHSTLAVSFSISFQKHVIVLIYIVLIVVIDDGRRRWAAEHAPGAREVDERDGERAEEAGEAGEGDGLLHRVPWAAEEETVRHDRAHRAAARRHAGHHTQRPAPIKPILWIYDIVSERMSTAIDSETDTQIATHFDLPVHTRL